MGQLWEMYEAYLRRHNPYPPSLRKVAGQVGLSPTALGNWRHGLDGMPRRRSLLAFADLTGNPYSRVVDAALADSRYLPEGAARAAEARDVPDVGTTVAKALAEKTEALVDKETGKRGA